MLRIVFVVCVLWPASVSAGHPLPALEDRVRVAEAYRLADSVQDRVWPGWSDAPFILLLVTPDHEYLFRHPSPPQDFQSLGRAPGIDEEIFARPNSGQFPLNFKATFPAVGGLNTVVIGQPEHTGDTSTSWVIAALHEHFHQYQFTRENYHASVEALGLSNGDTSGMWQLNYPFPYRDADLQRQTRAWATGLRAALFSAPLAVRAGGAGLQRNQLMAGLNARDARYLSFQLWQEGISRYTEYKVAEAAIAFHQPSGPFSMLQDFIPYHEAHKALMADLDNELATLDLGEWQRVAFYPLGAAEALLLDEINPAWKQAYFDAPFSLSLGEQN